MQELRPAEYRQRWSEQDEQAGRVLLLDVREPHELEISRLPQAIHIPMGEVPARLDEIARGRTLVVLCRSGGRSAQVAQFLERNGFDDVYNLAGGINAWAEEIDPALEVY